MTSQYIPVDWRNSYRFFGANTTAVLSVLLSLLTMSGCSQQNEIRSYTAPRDKTTSGETSSGQNGAASQKVRLLGLIIPRSDNESWFVKFSGPAEQIEPYLGVFDEFIRSLRVHPGAPAPTYTPPPGWTQAPARAMRIVTFVPPGSNKQPELYISQPFGGSVLDNVNRWRGEVGLPAVSPTELSQVTTEISLGDVKAYRVDFSGPGGKSRMPPFAK
jgi:hypothetical protein